MSHQFTDTNDGSVPNADVILDRQGNVYGTTQFGGPAVAGNVFKVTPAGVTTSLYDFSQGLQTPVAGLLLGKGGVLYGTATFDGDNADGGVFSVETDGTAYQALSVFAGPPGPSRPFSDVVRYESNLIGTTLYGGSASAGDIFQVAPDGTTTTLYTFQGAGDGCSPRGGRSRAGVFSMVRPAAAAAAGAARCSASTRKRGR